MTTTDAHAHQLFDPSALAAVKRARRLTVSVCIPARDEATTVAGIVAPIVDQLVAGHRLVDQVIVVDDGSADATGDVAAAAGASVVRRRGLPGKGAAMARGAAVAGGDIVVFLDADVSNFGCHFVVGLLGPQLGDDDIMLVKADYQRSCHGRPGQGGRVTELLARPLLEQLLPSLAFVKQPLAGEYAIRRRALDHLALDTGYGVDIGILIDVASRYSGAAIAQVDLGERIHRNRPLPELAAQAREVLAAVLARAPVDLRAARGAAPA